MLIALAAMLLPLLAVAALAYIAWQLVTGAAGEALPELGQAP